MFSVFKKKSELKEKYTDLISDANIAKLKIDMVKQVSSIKKTPQLSEEDKKELIAFFINKIPSLLQAAIKEGKDTVHIFGCDLSLQNKHIKTYGSYDIIFTQIADDLFSLLKVMELDPYLGMTKTAISISVKKLMEFCNFEKLAVLK